MAKKYERIKLTWGQAYPSMSTTICMQIVAGRLHEAKRGAGLCELWPRIMGKHSQHDAMHRTFLRPCYFLVAFKGQSRNLVAYCSWSTSDSRSLKISNSKNLVGKHTALTWNQCPRESCELIGPVARTLGGANFKLQTQNMKIQEKYKKYFLGTFFLEADLFQRFCLIWLALT